ncbi:MAG: 6-carboxytetrahydropterin synthase [Candidatus Zixiibacteriota bacterium]
MHLVLSKRFELSLSYRYYRPDWTEEKNFEAFGPWVGGEHGYGGNPTAYFVFTGPVEADTGMIINVTLVKQRINELLTARYDHKFLNRDTPPFDKIVPTPENMARELFRDASGLFHDTSARLVACHLEMSPYDAATAYADGRVEREYLLEFSAARRTCSPLLSDEENEKLFGAAASYNGHGHAYRLRVVLEGDIDSDTGMIVPEKKCREYLDELHRLLDHKHLNLDVAELKQSPMTTEYLAAFMFNRLHKKLPLTRVRLWENRYFSSECRADGHSLMVVENSFRAAHRLNSSGLSESDNLEIYGKCNNPSGHGHLYRVETALEGIVDKRTGTLFPLVKLLKGIEDTLEVWNFKHLDTDTNDFRKKPSTGENIVQVLWPKLERALYHKLYRLRLWETPNNRFTLRRAVK